MSYAEIKPQYYRMHQPDSPWHAGSPGWSTAPWPSFMPNPNLVGPPRLAVEGLGNPNAFGVDATPAAADPSAVNYTSYGGFPWFTALICGTVLGVTYLRRRKY